jgi:hypothetical protein
LIRTGARRYKSARCGLRRRVECVIFIAVVVIAVALCLIVDRRRGAPRGDLAIRRSIERVVFDVRTDIAKACSKAADECGEPPLDVAIE